MDSITIKTWHGDDVRRFTMATSRPLTYEHLVAQVTGLYPVLARSMFGRGGSHVLQWTDADGDRVSITNDAELRDAVAAVEPSDRTLRVRIHARGQPAAATPLPEAISSLSLADLVNFDAAAPSPSPIPSSSPAPAPAACFAAPPSSTSAPAPTPASASAEDKPKPIDLGAILSSVFGQVTTELGKVSQHLQEMSEKQREAARKKAEERTARKEAEDAARVESLAAEGEQGIRDAMEHTNVICDGCGGSIFGSRFKCAECADFDLCQTCEAAGFHPGHLLLRIRVPTNMGGPAPQRRRHGHGWRSASAVNEGHHGHRHGGRHHGHGFGGLFGGEHAHHGRCHGRRGGEHHGEHRRHSPNHSHSHTHAHSNGDGERGFGAWLMNGILSHESPAPADVPSDLVFDMPEVPTDVPVVSPSPAPSVTVTATAAEHLQSHQSHLLQHQQQHQQQHDAATQRPGAAAAAPAPAPSAPAPATSAVLTRFSDEVRQLKEMGFADIDQVVRLLEQFSGNIDQVLGQLLA